MGPEVHQEKLENPNLQKTLLAPTGSSSSTLIWRHVHVWSRCVVAHGLPLGHVHLVLHWHALGRGDSVIVTTHRPVAAGWQVHRAAGHVGGLVGTWPGTLHGHVIWPWEIATQVNGDAPGKAQDCCRHRHMGSFLSSGENGKK